MCVFGLPVNSSFEAADDTGHQETHFMKPEKEEMLAMLTVACILMQNAYDEEATELLELLLVRLEFEDETGNKRNLFTYLDDEDTFEDVTVDRLSFTDPGDERTFDCEMFSEEEWTAILEYVLLLYTNPGLYMTNSFVSIMKEKLT